MSDTNLPAAAVVNGGTEIEVKTIDGKSEKVKVRLVPVRQFDDYMKVVFDQPAFVEFVTGKDKGWADNLTDESMSAIDEMGRKLNDPRLDRHLDRQMAVVNQAKPMAEKAGALTRSLQT